MCRALPDIGHSWPHRWCSSAFCNFVVNMQCEHPDTEFELNPPEQAGASLASCGEGGSASFWLKASHFFVCCGWINFAFNVRGHFSHSCACSRLLGCWVAGLLGCWVAGLFVDNLVSFVFLIFCRRVVY